MAVIIPVLFVAAGALVGWLYFRIMYWAVERFSRREMSVLAFMALALVRIAFVVGVAFGAVATGVWWNLLAYFMGFFAARVVTVRAARSEANAPPRDGGQHG